VLQSANGVVSLGGGAPISAQAQKLIQNSGAIVIFLDISLGKAAARVGFNRDRPLLLGNPRAQWNELMNSRRPIYERLATAVIAVDDRSVNEICADILAVA
jgi:shikimate kinase